MGAQERAKAAKEKANKARGEKKTKLKEKSGKAKKRAKKAERKAKERKIKRNEKVSKRRKEKKRKRFVRHRHLRVSTRLRRCKSRNKGLIRQLKAQLNEKNQKIKELHKARRCATVNGLMRENARLRKHCKITGRVEEALGDSNLEDGGDGEGDDGTKLKSTDSRYFAGLLGAISDGEE